MRPSAQRGHQWRHEPLGRVHWPRIAKAYLRHPRQQRLVHHAFHIDKSRHPLTAQSISMIGKPYIGRDQNRPRPPPPPPRPPPAAASAPPPASDRADIPTRRHGPTPRRPLAPSSPHRSPHPETAAPLCPAPPRPAAPASDAAETRP